MKNLPPDIVVTASANGPALYNVQTKKFLSDEDIEATFDGLIDANTKAQLVDDAWYNFDYATGYKFDKDLGQKLYNDDLLNKKKTNFLFVKDVTTHQRKLLYNLLESKGYNRRKLFKHYSY